MGKEGRELTICSAVGVCIMDRYHAPWTYTYGTNLRLAPKERLLVKQEMKAAVSLLHPGPANRKCFPLISVDILPGQFIPVMGLKATG